MSIKDQINADLKAALLSGDKALATTLRGLKGSILNVEIDRGVRDTGLTDAQIIEILAKESKKRQESADMYASGGAHDKAESELEEKRVISKYLPEQKSDSELSDIVDGIMAKLGSGNMGQIIAAVKTEVGPGADGAKIASLVKSKLIK